MKLSVYRLIARVQQLDMLINKKTLQLYVQGLPLYREVPILYDKIEDSKDNHTRFMVCQNTENQVISKNDKTSILVNLSMDMVS